jgi:hypothetical protein
LRELAVSNEIVFNSSSVTFSSGVNTWGNLVDGFTFELLVVEVLESVVVVVEESIAFVVIKDDEDRTFLVISTKNE